MNYHKLPALGSSDIKNILQGDRQFLDGRQKEFSTSSTKFGTLCHLILFAPEKFNDTYAIYTGTKTRAHKEYKEFAEENQAKIIIKQTEADEARALVKPFNDVPVLQAAEKEKEMFATIEHMSDELSGTIELKGKMDAVFIADDRALILDLKTGADVIKKWERSCSELGYYLQEHHYRYILSQHTGIPLNNVKFVFMLAERSTGYTQLVELDEFSQEVADFRHSQALSQYLKLLKRVDLSQAKIADYPRHNIPAFELNQTITRGLPNFILAQHERRLANESGTTKH